MPYQYQKASPAIYAESFAIIRREADLARFAKEEETVAVRMIHAAGMVELAQHISFSPGMVATARQALAKGAPIITGVAPGELPHRIRAL